MKKEANQSKAAFQLGAAVFVYESTRRPYQSRAVFTGEAIAYLNKPGWRHTATLNPAAWIEYLLNHPDEREKQIESICFRKKGAL